jgi:hypothetical protein
MNAPLPKGGPVSPSLVRHVDPEVIGTFQPLIVPFRLPVERVEAPGGSWLL